MKRKKGKNKQIAWIIAVLSVFFGFYLDNVLIRGISFIRNSILDWLFLAVTFASSEIIIFAFLSALFLWSEKKRRWVLPLWVSAGISGVVSFILKVTIERQRPFQQGLVSLLANLNNASYNIWNFSFPSSHAMIAFCAIPILSQQFPRLKKVWVVFAVLIALSRVYFGLHFVSDVIAGAIMGYVVGLLVVRLEKEHKFGQKAYDKIMRR
jgi:undecaprenyl-diphosphatase